MQNKFAWSSAICVPSGCLNSLLTRGLFARLTDREGRVEMKISGERDMIEEIIFWIPLLFVSSSLFFCDNVAFLLDLKLNLSSD